MRITIARPFPPLAAYHTFVTSDGTSNSAIAVGKSMATVRMARLTVGRPSPITPLTVPAHKKVAIITKITEISNK